MYAAAFIRFFFSLEKSKVNETQVSNFPISLTDIERDHQTESRTKCIWKGHARHVLLCGDVFSVVFRSLFFQLLFLFHSIRFSTETYTHTHRVTHIAHNNEWKKQSSSHFTEKRKIQNHFMFAHQKLLLARSLCEPFPHVQWIEWRRKKTLLHVTINKAFNTIAVLWHGVWRMGSTLYQHVHHVSVFSIFLSRFQLLCVCVCHLSCIWIFFPSFFPSSIVLVVFC